MDVKQSFSGATALSKMTFSITTLTITIKNVKLSPMTLNFFAERRYAYCHESCFAIKSLWPSITVLANMYSKCRVPYLSPLFNESLCWVLLCWMSWRLKIISIEKIIPLFKTLYWIYWINPPEYTLIRLLKKLCQSLWSKIWTFKTK